MRERATDIGNWDGCRHGRPECTCYQYDELDKILEKANTKMAKIPEEIEVKIKLSQDSLDAIADLIGYGTVGSILDAAYEILVEVDSEMALKVDALAKECLARFDDAENILSPEVGI